MNNKNRFEVNICRFLNAQNNELYGKAMKLYTHYAEGLIEFKSPVHTLEQHLEQIIEEIVELTAKKMTNYGDTPQYQKELKDAIHLIDLELEEGMKQITNNQKVVDFK